MPLPIEIIEAEALGLTAAERTRLIEKLMLSLEMAPDIEDAWAAEVARRRGEIESGAVAPLPGPEALKDLKSEFE